MLASKISSSEVNIHTVTFIKYSILGGDYKVWKKGKVNTLHTWFNCSFRNKLVSTTVDYKHTDYLQELQDQILNTMI